MSEYVSEREGGRARERGGGGGGGGDSGSERGQRVREGGSGREAEKRDKPSKLIRCPR